MKKIISIILSFTIIIFTYIYFNYNKHELKYYEEILNEVEELEVSINNYSIFGTHFNIEGCVNDTLESASIVLKNKEEEIILDSIFFAKEDSTCFYISENNNDSINLDELKIGDYLLLIKDTKKIDENEKYLYYTLKNNTNYGNLEYYTITKNNSNNKINIDFKTYNKKNYLNFIIKEEVLSDNVYDISIDPGHGGLDPGSIGYLNKVEYYESNLTLKVSLLLKETLENMGLKVNITRSDDTYLEPYGEGGRALIANDTKSKYSLSIHFNSNYGIMKYGGVEIYTPNDINLSFASMLADNISEVVGYSKNNNHKLKNGVYYTYFKQNDIDESTKAILDNNMIPFDIKLNAPYMYMIREVGGVHTYAYIDGRNEYYGLNKYYNSNQTAEPYLLELAYINYERDLIKAVNNPELFAQAIANALKEYLNIS